MQIPEVKDLEMKALSHDRIKVGWAVFMRASIEAYYNSAATMGAMVFWYGNDPYWLTLADCNRALRLMDEWQEPKPAPKFKVGDWVVGNVSGLVAQVEEEDSGGFGIRYLGGGRTFVPRSVGVKIWQPRVGDWVRCTEPSHKGPNPFRINLDDTHRIYGGSSDPHSSQYYGCKPEWLVPAPLQEPCGGQTEEPREKAPLTPLGVDWKAVRQHAGGSSVTDRLLVSLDERVTRLESKCFVLAAPRERVTGYVASPVSEPGCQRRQAPYKGSLSQNRERNGV